jgi:predicted regulator of Ras-like GTPase activity (Roadblock/LC7/MglB family)
VLLMSGIVNDNVRERAARVKSSDVLSKPFAADDLLRRLDTLLTAAPPPAPPAPVAVPPPLTPPPIPAPALNGTNGHVEHAEPPVPVAPPPIVPPPVQAALPSPAATAAGSPAPSVSAAVLLQFAAIEGVQWAVLADREGFLLDASAEDVVNAEVASALSACLAESSEGLGRELGRGPLNGMILEYEQGMLVLYGVGASALLAIALGEPTVLGKVRYFAKKAVPELLQAI